MELNSRQFSSELAEIFLRNVIRPDVSARFAGFKEIRWFHTGEDLPALIDFIVRNFPNPHFILSSRNPEDVANSAWFAKNEKTRETARNISSQMGKFFDLAEEKLGDRAFRTTYEEFSTDPMALAPFFEKFGIKIDVKRIESVLQKKLTHGKIQPV